MATSLTEIVALAKDRTPAGRRRLASQFSDAFFTSQQNFSSAERALALDILTTLLRDAALEVRRELAELLARDPRVPRPLAVALAQDAIEVALPVLSYSPVLAEDDLVSIGRTGSIDHRLAIAHRDDLTDRVTEQLASAREAPVALALLGNIAIHIPESALRIMAQQALDHAAIGTGIAQRSELTAEVAQQIYWLVGQDLQRQIGGRFDLPAGVIEQALSGIVAQFSERQLDPVRRRSLADRLCSAGTVTAPFLIQLLKQNGVDLFRDLMKNLTRLKPDALAVLFGAEGSEPLALVCRALGFARTDTASLLMLVRGKVLREAQFNPSMLADALTTFARLTEGDAKTVLWQWQADPATLIALGQRHPTQ